MRLITADQIPLPTLQNPFLQIEWIFDQRALLEVNPSTRSNYSTCKTHFIQFLKEELQDSIGTDALASRIFDEYVLIRFKTYLDDSGLSSYSRVGHLSAARGVLKYAIDNDFIRIKEFINVTVGPACRETDDRRPYTENELNEIGKMLDGELAFSRSLITPYKKSEIGKDPREKRGGWKIEDNMRWYFENVLVGKPITKTTAGSKAHKTFLQQATDDFGGLHKMYHRWGVVPYIDEDIIAPYLYRLIQITGLNPSVALTLKVDAFCEKHPLTEQPYIRYWKERANGEKELHLSLFSTKWMRLTGDQAREIASIWSEVQQLTQAFRDELKQNEKDFLFIYQSTSVKMPGRARMLFEDPKTYMNWASRVVAKYKLVNIDGSPLRLSLSRFRPSLVSRLVKKDVDLDIIQSILGHKSIIQTIRYIDSHDFAPDARKKVTRCLESIYANHSEQKKEKVPVAIPQASSGKVVYATGLALCKNVFNPPEFIKKSASFSQSQACTNFNMCLRCSNVVIMKEHLPKLFALRESYLTALKNGLAQSTHKSAVLQTLWVLDHLIEPGKSEFSEEDLRWAKELSETEDPLIDPISYRGVVS